MKMRSSAAIAIAIILLISCSFIRTPQVPSSPSSTITFSQPVPVEPSATLESSITPAPTLTDTLPPPTTCEGNFTGIHITMPNNAWTCSITTGFFEDIHLNSPLFSIVINYAGRGPYCEIPDESCVVTEFYKNQYVTLFTSSYKGEIKEIFGFTDRKVIINGSDNYFWISIKYQGMESRELTPAEKQELIQLLDSITFTK